MNAPKCRLCGGNAGRLSPDGAHYLCIELHKRGMPTPSLGERCPRCNGVGTAGKGGVPLFLSLGPAAIARSLGAQFPPVPKLQWHRHYPRIKQVRSTALR